MRPYCWKYHVNDEEYAWAAQIPLKAAYALTIHKSQGQTIDRLEMSVDDRYFAEGQAYVALSRARTLEDIRLTKFSRFAIKTNEAVRAFYESLNDVQ